MKRKQTQLKRDDKFPTDISDALYNINERAGDGIINQQQYTQEICDLFGEDMPTITKDRNIYLGGFVEGEGSINCSIKISKGSTAGIDLDPEFSVTQHVNGVKTLIYALVYFKTGRILRKDYKSETNFVLSFRISNTRSIIEVVLPFYTEYIVPYGSRGKVERFKNFSTLMPFLNNTVHHLILPRKQIL